METALDAHATAGLETLEAVAALYAAEASRIRARVRGAVEAPEAVVEDACQIAWSRLIVHRASVRRDGATAWLFRTALHEAYRLLRRADREVPLEAVQEDPAREPATPPLLDELAHQHGRLAGLRILPDRQRRLIWMRGLGLSYGEISCRTGDSERTIERQLKRARQTLRRAGV